jgi:hypothetical protein
MIVAGHQKFLLFSLSPENAVHIGNGEIHALQLPVAKAFGEFMHELLQRVRLLGFHIGIMFSMKSKILDNNNCFT